MRAGALTSSEPLFATRLNSFAAGAEWYWPDQSGRPSVLQMAARAATVPGLSVLDLNYPAHLTGEAPATLARGIRDLGLEISGLAMRYYSERTFRAGAFTHPDPAVRRQAIDLTKRGIDAARACAAPLMTLWMGEDGFDYAFQADYRRLWDMEIEAIGEVAAHDPEVAISLEYKPNEPRCFCLLADAATTLLAIREVGLPNLGVTLDFAHSLYAGEQPAAAAALIARHARLLGMHLNDGLGKRDDGLMVGSVHPAQTVELLRQVRRDGYAGALYFDTFPDATGLDPVRECAANIRVVRRMLAAAEQLEASNGLAQAQAQQDAVAAQRIVQALLAGEAADDVA